MNLLFAFGLPHGMEWFWIALIVIVLFGADKLPKLAKGLGKSFSEFRRAKDEFEQELHSAANTKPGTTPEEPRRIDPPQPHVIHTSPTIPATSIVAESELSKRS